MKMLNILKSKDYTDEPLQLLITKNYSKFANIVESPEDLIEGLTTIVYGYDTARNYWPNDLHPLEREIFPKVYWIPNRKKLTFYTDDIALDYCVISEIEKFLYYVDMSIDPVFDGFNVDSFIESMEHRSPLIHTGKYEIYLAVFGDEKMVYSIKKDALKYIGIDPSEFINKVIDSCDGCYVLESDEYDFCMRGIDSSHILYMVDMIQALTGRLETPDDVCNAFSPMYITKGQLLSYYMESHLQALIKYGNQVGVDTYSRIVSSSIAEQILGECSVFIDVPKLQALNRIPKSGDKDRFKFMRKAIEGDGYISSKYYSRDKRTFRIFPAKKELNLINLSSEDVLKSMRSRYKSGKIVCMDYSNFEYSIMRGIFEELTDTPADLHQWAADLFDTTRDSVKAMNHAMVYGSTEDIRLMIRRVRELVEKSSNNNNNGEEYINTIFKIRGMIKDYTNGLVDGYKKNGYVLNHYGRKIYPKNEDSIFNNIIQSNGSEVMVDALISLWEKSKREKWNILFQRFDAIYFDFSSEALLEGRVDEVKKIMEGVNDNYDLSVSIKMGDSVYKLKE